MNNWEWKSRTGSCVNFMPINRRGLGKLWLVLTALFLAVLEEICMERSGVVRAEGIQLSSDGSSVKH